MQREGSGREVLKVFNEGATNAIYMKMVLCYKVTGRNTDWTTVINQASSLLLSAGGT